MSDTAIVERDVKTGRFLVGSKPGPGRPVGSRNLLTTQFLDDLKSCWERNGASVLERVARDEPAALLKTVAMLLPREAQLDIDIQIQAGEAIEAFRALLGVQPMKTIEHEK
jgi:hypothetical protein